jgi:WxcM-like, C-terminal
MWDVRTIRLPKVQDDRGHLSFFQNYDQIPFKIKRVHWFYNAVMATRRHTQPPTSTRDFIVALSGSFEIAFFDRNMKDPITLNRPYTGVYVPPLMRWQLHNFSANSVALIATDDSYLKSHDSRVRQSIAQSLTGRQASISDCNLITFPHTENAAGQLSPAANNILPFEVQRIYYIYDIPHTGSRGAHAHKTLHQIIIAARGSFAVAIDDGVNKTIIQLNTPYIGLHIQPSIWRSLSSFSQGAVCLALVSEQYSADDYIRDYSDFLDYRAQPSNTPTDLAHPISWK